MSGSIDLGLVIYTSVKPIFKIYFIVGMGYWLARRNVLNVSTCRDISDTIVTAILPCLVFENVVSNLQSTDIKSLGIVFFVAFLLFGFGVLLTFGVSIIARSPKRWLGGLLSVGLFPNISDLPIAYVQTLSKGGGVFTAEQGDKGVAYIIIFLAAQALVQFSFGLYELIEWDFRKDIHDEEAVEQKYTPSDTESTAVKDEKKNIDDRPSTANTNNDSTNAEVNDNVNTNNNTNNETTSQNYPDEELSISSSITQEELPPPTDIGTDVAGTSSGHYHQTLLPKDLETVSQSLSRRISSRGRRNSLASAGSNLLRPSRSRDLRSLKSQDMNDVINEYSEYEGLRDNSVDRIITAGSDVGGSNIVMLPSNTSQAQKTIKALIKKRLLILAKNLVSPVSATLIVSLAIAMAPPLKALFVHSAFDIPDAPDSLPPLSFILDITDYVGAASVPLGLLLLGATISRLEIKTMPKGFWKTAVGIVLSRLVILPIIGVGLTTGLQQAGWYGDDKLLRFICVLEYGLPSATSLVYFTAFYTDPNSTDHLQMDCLAAALIFQYAILFISLPFLVSFTIKVSLGY